MSDQAGVPGWYGLYAGTWNGDIVPAALSSLSCSVSGDNVATPGASLTSPAYNRIPTNYAQFIGERPFSTGNTGLLPLVIGNKLPAANRAILAICSGLIARPLALRRAIPTTKKLLHLFIGTELLSALGAILFDQPGQSGFVVTTAKLIKHGWQNVRAAYVEGFFHRSGRDADVGVLLCNRNGHGKAEVVCNRPGNSVVILFGKLLSGDGNSRSIPGAVITNQTSQSDRMGHEAGYLIGDYLCTVLIKVSRYLREAGRGDGVETAAPSGFSASLVGIGAKLDRARMGVKPAPFLLKPVQLFLGVITRKMMVDPIGRFAGGHISQHRTNGYLLLKLS